MGHDHAHGASNFGRAFIIGIALNLAFVVIEFLYGKWAHSLALVSDAGHNLSDVLGLGLAWGASVLATRNPTAKRTYGMRRTTIFAALLNSATILVAVGAIAWEALQRFSAPQAIEGRTVIIVAAIGILVNGVSAYFFAAGSKDDLNIRGAFLHLAADAAVSLGVVAAGFVILLTGWQILDPLASLAISAVIVWGVWGLLRDSVNLALDAVPESINLAEVTDFLRSQPHCREVHDLHVWALSANETALTAHLVMPHAPKSDAVLSGITHELHEKFDIDHATLQIEAGDAANPCGCRLIKSEGH